MAVSFRRALLALVGADQAIAAGTTVQLAPSADETLDVIYHAAMAKIEQQKREVDFLDTKAIGVLTAASLVVTVAPAARLSTRIAPLGFVALVLLVVAGVLYALLMWHVRSALQERLFDFPPNPRTLFDNWWDQPAREVKGVVVDQIATEYEKNKTQIRHKVDAIGTALWLLFAESLTLVVGLVFS